MHVMAALASGVEHGRRRGDPPSTSTLPLSDPAEARRGPGLRSIVGQSGGWRWLGLIAVVVPLTLYVAAQQIATGRLVDLVALTVSVAAVGLGAAAYHVKVLEHERAAQLARDSALDLRTEAEARLRLLIENVPAVVYLDSADEGVSDGGRLTYISARVEDLLGYPPSAFIDDPELFPGLIHPDDLDGFLATVLEHWKSRRPFRADYRMRTRLGNEIWVRDEGNFLSGADGHLFSQGVLYDISERKRVEDELRHAAGHDALTGIANRKLFRERLEASLGSERPTNIGVAFLDVDDFKGVNDRLGHDAGDALLVEIGRRLVAGTRVGDVAARLGGDEFGLLLEGIETAADAEVLIERIGQDLRRPYDLRGQRLLVGISIGLVVAPRRPGTSETVVAQADAAQYEVKRLGKNQTRVAGAAEPANPSGTALRGSGPARTTLGVEADRVR